MGKVTQIFVAITFADDSVGVMGFVVAEYPEGEAVARWVREPTLKAIDEEIARTSFGPNKPPVTGWRYLDESTVPADRTFRDAWVDDGRAIIHDMPKARDICLARLRLERNKKLDALDNDWMRASGQKDAAEADAVEAKRQELRDFPADIAAALAAAKDVEALKAIALPE